MADGDICAVVGPSGAGKTSMLRIIAGLDPHEGKVLINDQEIQQKRPYERSIGFVSQDLHLFPHLTLERNLLLAMHRSGMKRSLKSSRIRELLELLRIAHLAGRKPDTFSGGEKQRAALARVLASSPEVLLLDEPFSKLDFRTARYLRNEFRNLRKRLKLTTIIVTHDMKEATDMAETIWVMQNGSLTSSVSAFSKGDNGSGKGDTFLEIPNVIACKQLECLDNGLVQAKWAGGELLIPYEGESFTHFTVGRRKILIGTEPPEGPPINRFQGMIGDVNIKDDGVIISIKIDSSTLVAEIPCDSWNRTGLSQGEMVH
ncbi:MAG: ATP-binding cassette domain-containing protein, partial [Desulfobacteraceae bacterium]